MSKLWKKLDPSFGSVPHHIFLTGCEIWYAREYDPNEQVSGGAKSLVLNFKKKIGIKESHPNQWYWRNKDLQTFGDELLKLFGGRSFHLMAIPGSKPWSHPDNNQRFQDLFKYLLSKQPNLVIHWPIDAINAVPSSAEEDGSRDPEIIKSNYRWLGFIGSNPEKILIIDDVLTSGAHFKATVDFLRENGFEGIMKGIFWAKTN